MGGAGYIPFLAIVVYALLEDLPTFELLMDLRFMDDAFLKRQEEMREAEKARAERAAKQREKRNGRAVRR